MTSHLEIISSITILLRPLSTSAHVYSVHNIPVYYIHMRVESYFFSSNFSFVFLYNIGTSTHNDNINIMNNLFSSFLLFSYAYFGDKSKDYILF